MKIEVVIIYVLQVLFVLLEAYVAYLILKYLKRKSLGMQTVLDKVVKDAILSVLFDQMLRVFVMGLIVEFARPLSDDMALIITTLIHFFSVLRIWYMFSLMIVRHILVFYHTYLNILDEKVTRRLIRSFVCIFSAIIVLLDSTNNSKYYLLIGDEYLDLKTGPKFFSMLGILNFIALIYSQYHIEKFKKAVDCRSFDNLETIQAGQGAEKCINQMHFNPYRIEIITGFSFGFIIFIYQSSLYVWHGDLYINRLRKTLLMQVLTIILVLMFVFKNEKIYCFVKHRILSQLLCLSSDDIHIHNNDNSDMYAIYKPKYEVHDNFNFDKTEEEIVTKHDDTQLGPQNVCEFSSVIFVKEKDSDSQNINRASVSINIGKNYSNHYAQMPGCSHWPDDV